MAVQFLKLLINLNIEAMAVEDLVVESKLFPHIGSAALR